MKYYLVLLCGFVTCFGFTQSNTNSPATNTEQNTIIDSSYQKNEIEIKAVKKSKVQSAEKAESYNAKDLEAPTIKSYSTTFTHSKQQASVQRTQRTPSEMQQKQMDNVVDQLEETAPESFEFHYYKYVAGNYDISLIDHLKKAETLKPNNSDVQTQMAAYYLIKNDSKSTLTYLTKLVDNSKLTKDVLNYSEDLLQSAPENGVLITHGFDDTYSVSYLQLKNKLRTDVQIISLDLLQSKDYRKLLSERGFVMPERTVIDVQFLKEFCSKNVTKNLSVSMTTPKEYLTSIQQNLFVVGLVFEYHTDLTFDNFFKNNYLWYEVFSKKIISTAVTEKSKQLGANYLPMLLHLRMVYSQKNDTETVKKLDETIDKVSVQCKKYDQVQKLKASY